MAQCGWTVLGNQGRHYKIGLYHGQRSGHLMVHCNAKVMLIDFGVLDSKSYTFFLDEQLYEIRLVRSGNTFSYSCELNEEADTPYNRERKVVERRNWKKAAWMAVAFFGLLAICSFLIARQMRRTQEAAAKEERSWVVQGRGLPTTMRVVRQGDTWRYSYLAEDKISKGVLLDRDTIHPLGFPLVDGDEFQILYHPAYHSIYHIQWEELPEGQLQKYVQRTMDLHLEEHPEIAARQARCQVNAAYDMEGLPGVATLYHQRVPPNSRAEFDENRYLRLVRSDAFREETRDCL